VDARRRDRARQDLAQGSDAHQRRARPHPQGDRQRRRIRAGEGRREGPGLHSADLPGQHKPINLFVSSERSTIGLLLQPVDTPSDAIVIREGRDAVTGPARIERSGRHVRTMKNLLLAMAEDALPDDMEVREPGRELTLWPGARLTLQRQWLGAGVVGEKYQLVNTGASALDLAERDLFKRGVMAVSVEQPALRPGETTQLFVIRERRADD
jgi:conjugal transfer pilus assembly protein TraK